MEDAVVILSMAFTDEDVLLLKKLAIANSAESYHQAFQINPNGLSSTMGIGLADYVSYIFEQTYDFDERREVTNAEDTETFTNIINGLLMKSNIYGSDGTYHGDYTISYLAFINAALEQEMEYNEPFLLESWEKEQTFSPCVKNGFYMYDLYALLNGLVLMDKEVCKDYAEFPGEYGICRPYYQISDFYMKNSSNNDVVNSVNLDYEFLRAVYPGVFVDGKSCTDNPVSASICEISGEKLDQIQEIEDYLAKREVYKNAYLDAGNGTC